MDEEDKAFIGENPDIDLYHFGYAMWIRNNYIHCAKLHYEKCLDGASGTVMSYIFTLLRPFYNCENRNFLDLWHDSKYSNLKEQYGEKYPIIYQTAERLSSPFSTETAQEALDSLTRELQNILGHEYIKEQIAELVGKYYDTSDLTSHQSYDFINDLYDVTRLFPKEYRQIVALREIGVFIDLINTYIVKFPTVDSLYDYICNDVGFKEKDSRFLASCLWEAFEKQKTMRNSI